MEMLVLCDEMVGWTVRMAAGCEVDDDDIAYEVVKRAVPDDSYPTDKHTQDRYRTENWDPNLIEPSDADV